MQSKAVKIIYKGAKITSRIIGELIRDYLRQTERQTYGKQSLKKLNQKGRAIDSIPVINQDLKGMKRELKKYGVDYSVRKRLSEDNTYDVYFKGSDINQIQTALRNYTTKTFQKNLREKPLVKEQMKEAVHKAKERNQNWGQHDKVFERGHNVR